MLDITHGLESPYHSGGNEVWPYYVEIYREGACLEGCWIFSGLHVNEGL